MRTKLVTGVGNGVGQYRYVRRTVEVGRYNVSGIYIQLRFCGFTVLGEPCRPRPRLGALSRYAYIVNARFLVIRCIYLVKDVKVIMVDCRLFDLAMGWGIRIGAWNH